MSDTNDDRPAAGRDSVRFSVAGVEVWLRSVGGRGLGQLAGYYERYPSAGREPDLVVEVETVPGFAAGRERGAEYPAFSRESAGPGRIRLARFDGQGELALPDGDGPVRGRFRVGDSPNTLEAVVRIGMSLALPRRGALILHASAVAVDQRAWVFAGKSGAGKSTIAAMLASALPGCRKLSDELLIAAPEAPGEPGAAAYAGERWLAHATPFIGGHDLDHGARVPIAGVYFLAQAPVHECVPMSRADGVRELLRHVLTYAAGPGDAARVLDAAARWLQATPCHGLRFARDPGVASVLGIT